jgi:hypothetical protein
MEISACVCVTVVYARAVRGKVKLEKVLPHSVARTVGDDDKSTLSIVIQQLYINNSLFTAKQRRIHSWAMI